MENIGQIDYKPACENKGLLLSLERYSFLLKPKEDISLPFYKGSTLRGGFGITFCQICCINKMKRDCHDCLLKERCVYSYIFESSPSPDAQKLKKIAEIPRPFVIEPPIEAKNVYHRGETIAFNLVLIGKAVEYLPYFIFTFKELGNIGIGRGRGTYELDKIYNSSQEKIYDSLDDTIRISGLRTTCDWFVNTSSSESDCISLHFITLTRIKFRDDLITRPEFHVLVRSLLHRISALSYFHCGVELKLNYHSLISRAEEITIKRANLKWVDWERYSSRQDTKMKLGGFVGEITYNGNIDPFLSLFLTGQYVHIGKNCTFGLGKYEILRGR